MSAPTFAAQVFEGIDGPVATLWSKPRGQHIRRPLVLMFSGAGRSAVQLLGSAREFSRLFDVVISDLPGHGFSAPPQLVSLDHFAKAISALTIQVATDRPVLLIGESLAGLIALKIAADPPSNLLAVVADDPPLSTPSSQAWRRQFEELARRVEGGKSWSEFVFEFSGIRDAAYAVERDHSALLGSSKVPVLLVTGDDFTAALPPLMHELDRIRILASKLPLVSIKLLPGCGHKCLFKKPDEVLSLILEFLQAYRLSPYDTQG